MLFFFIPAFLLSAQETVVLKRGPVDITGIDPLPRNAHPAYYGEYVYGGIIVRVFFTHTDIYRPESWPRSTCSGYSIYSIPSEDLESVYIYQDDGGWTCIMEFPVSGDYCPFIRELIRKLVYFQGVSRGTGAFSFPAILELSG